MASVPDQVELLRMFWRPAADNGLGGLHPHEVFPREDLEDPARYVSVDRADIQDDGINWRMADIQQERERSKLLQTPDADISKKQVRKCAFFASLSCGMVRAIELESGGTAFDVSEKTEGFYPSHCGIKFLGKGRAKVNEARTKLMDCIIDPVGRAFFP